MTFPPIEGHQGLRESLTGAVRAGSLPGSLLIHGPEGSGKQRLGIWLATALLCQGAAEDGPCGSCKSCRMMARLEHPDFHWFFPLPRPKTASSPERLADALEEARAVALEEIRSDPLAIRESDEPRGLYLAVAQILRRKASQRPSMGNRQVFLVGHAEELVPQESSPEAANALLKLLEEPGPGTTFILTSSRPGRVIATIRSRTVPIHVPALKVDQVREFLVRHAGAPAEEAEAAAARSGGSIGRALGFLPQGEEDGPLEAQRKQAFRLFRAALEGPEGSEFAAALAFPVARARTLIPLLDALELWVRDAAAVAAGSREGLANSDAAAYLTRILGEGQVHPTRLVRCLQFVEDARLEASGNVNPQLIVHGLLRRMRRELASIDVPAQRGRTAVSPAATP